jgi:hypothetical protein
VKYGINDILNREFAFDLDTSKAQVVHRVFKKVKNET